jgi:ATP-dependent protease ClpP protease subunit
MKLKQVLCLAALTAAFCLTSCVSKPIDGEAKAPKVEVIEITVNNTTFITGEFNPQMFHATCQAMIGGKVVCGEEPLNVIILSGGGSVEVGKQLALIINKVPNIRLICLECDSAASYLFVSSKKERLMLKESVIGMHEVKWTLPQTMITPELVDRAKEENDAFDQVYADAMGTTLEEYRKHITDQFWAVKGPEAVKLKLADRIIKIHCDEAAKAVFPVTCQFSE